jgi:pimeloyl-ACP methyl ester carboxylesterase
MPAQLRWRFRREDARQIGQPVLYIGGTDSGPWFAEVRDLVLAWLPQAHDVMPAGADHSLALTHAAQVAAAMNVVPPRSPHRGLALSIRQVAHPTAWTIAL